MSDFTEDMDKAAQIAAMVKMEFADDEELLHDMLQGETKAFSYIERAMYKYGLAKEILAGIEEREKELNLRKSRIKNRMESLRSFMGNVMETCQIDKKETPDGTIYKRRVAPKVVVTDENLVPAMFKKIEERIDKAAINAAFKSGVVVDGCTIDNGGVTYAIR